MPFNKARDMIEMKKCVWQPEYYKDMIAMPLSLLYEKYHQALTVEDIIFTATCTRKRNASPWTTMTSSSLPSIFLRKTRTSG